MMIQKEINGRTHQSATAIFTFILTTLTIFLNITAHQSEEKSKACVLSLASHIKLHGLCNDTKGDPGQSTIASYSHL